MVTLGTFVSCPGLQGATEVTYVGDARKLEGICQEGWFAAYAAERLGLAPPNPPFTGKGELALPDEVLATHLFAVGASNSGKTRVLIRLLEEQLRAGCSALVFDHKGDLTDFCLAAAERSDLAPACIVIIDPASRDGVPGWNPFLSRVPLPEAVADFVTVLWLIFASAWGARLANLLRAAASVVAAHRLSVYELVRLLLVDAYREELLRVPVDARFLGQKGHSQDDLLPYREARFILREEFAAWSPSERRNAVAPITNKLYEITSLPFWRALLTSRRNTFEPEDLFHRQTLVIVRLGAGCLGEVGSRLLTGLLTHSLFRAALRNGGNGAVPVALLLDELPVLERSAGRVLSDIVSQARSLGLRFQCAFQHWGQIQPDLRGALATSAATQLFMRLGHDDALSVAGILNYDFQPQLEKVTVTEDEGGGSGVVYWTLPFVDEDGEPYNPFDQNGWALSCKATALRSVPPGARGLVVYGESADGKSVPNAWLRNPGTGRLERAVDFIDGLPEEVGRIVKAQYMVLRFPAPQFSNVGKTSPTGAQRRWVRVLSTLPSQHAVARLNGQYVGLVRIADTGVGDATTGHLRRIRLGSHAANSQSPGEITRLLEQQEQDVRDISAGGHIQHPRPEGEDDDGSIS